MKAEKWESGKVKKKKINESRKSGTGGSRSKSEMGKAGNIFPLFKIFNDKMMEPFD